MADPISAAGTALSVVSFGLTACQGRVKYYRSWKDCPEDVDRTCADLERLMRTLQDIEQIIRNGELAAAAMVNRVEDNIILCRDGVQKLERRLGKIRKRLPPNTLGEKIRMQGRIALYPFRESTLAKLRENVSDLRANLDLTLKVLELDKLNGIDAEVRGARREQRNWHYAEENRLILDWLSPLDFYDRHRDILAK